MNERCKGGCNLPTLKHPTIDQFFRGREGSYHSADDTLALLYDIAVSAKIIAGHVRRAAITGSIGDVGVKNVQDEEQQKLDVLANNVIKNEVVYTGRVCISVSEEEPCPIVVPTASQSGRYVIAFDPLDGSSNIDCGMPIGSIFSVRHRSTRGDKPNLDDVLQSGRSQVLAGYVIYGSSTILVFSNGTGVHGFTLDPSIGEFLLTYSDIITPSIGRYYSINEGHSERWIARDSYLRALRLFKKNGEHAEGKKARYVGSLVADFHRNLLAGGIFISPANTDSPDGVLRLLYEAAPLAFIMEQAGGSASDGVEAICDIKPHELHQRTPLVIGGQEDVALVERAIRENGGS